MIELAATTRLVAVLGSPVRHSLSPVLHGAAFRALGLDWACAAFDVDREQGADALRGAAALGLAGLSITMPLKAVAAETCDELDAAAAHLQAVNCVVITPDGRLEGHNTDGAGFVDSLELDRGVAVSGQRVIVLGAGGAARAVVAALAAAGASDVAVVNRTATAGEVTAALAGTVGRVGNVDVDVPSASIVVNATSVGMGGGQELPCDPSLLRVGQVVVDLVYHPVRTAFLEAAEAAGAVPVDGVGMLVHQAAHALRWWTGLEAPVEVMQAAARAELA